MMLHLKEKEDLDVFFQNTRLKSRTKDRTKILEKRTYGQSDVRRLSLYPRSRCKESFLGNKETLLRSKQAGQQQYFSTDND